jgi:hypothetical protein
VERSTGIVVAAVVGMLGVTFYVAAWAVAGMLTPDYDPLRQAISETFAIGAPTVPATLVRVSLVVSGVALVAFGWALEHGLPGTGRAGPVVCAVSGVLTVLVAVFPCTAGCPGVGASFTDTMHVVVAGGGYLTLLVTPLLVARRVRDHAPVFARWSRALGGLALLGFATRNLGVDVLPGLQQRAFNTIADAWYVVAGIVLIARVRRHGVGR